jgi:hypothetical protein
MHAVLFYQLGCVPQLPLASYVLSCCPAVGLVAADTAGGCFLRLQVAERLYTSGYLSYPRTESSGYPPNFDFEGASTACHNCNAHTRSQATNHLGPYKCGSSAAAAAGDCYDAPKELHKPQCSALLRLLQHKQPLFSFNLIT